MLPGGSAGHNASSRADTSWAPGRRYNRQSNIGNCTIGRPHPAIRNLDVIQRFTPPVLLFNLLNLLFVHSEVVAEFMNDGLGDAIANFLLVLACLFDGSLID